MSFARPRRLRGPDHVTGADGEVIIGLFRDPEGHVVGVASS